MKKKKYILLIIMLTIVGLIGFSYGYYILMDKQGNNNIAGSKCFKLELSNSKNEINLTNMYPISDEEGRKLTPYSFTITNTCDMLAGYTVNMEMLESTTLNSKYLDVMVNNEEIKLLNSYEETSTVIDGSTEARILAKGTLAYNDTADYTVRFWMDKDVEDVDAMNKYFASKIVIDATPSSWNPKDAGYDTLHDAILANEYQTSPEDALKKIEAKGTPDLSNTAPAIKWVETTSNEITTASVIKPAKSMIKSDDLTSELDENTTLMHIYSSYQVNNETGDIKLSDLQIVDPTTLEYGNNKKYYYATEQLYYNITYNRIYETYYGGSTIIYEIQSVTKENTTYNHQDKTYNAIKYNLNVKEITLQKMEVDNSDKGIYCSTDNYGTTYYYRGNVKNNYVYFADYYWRVVRINGDGSIRLIFSGDNKTTYIGKSEYNITKNSPVYAGYMYGNDVSTRESGIKNEKNSTIKTFVDNWYQDNLIEYAKYLSDAGFCNDRSLQDGDGYSTDKYTSFKGYYRYGKNSATYICPDNNDFFTIQTSNIGNKALTYPIGLISADEITYAGLNRGINDDFYLNDGYYLRTMTPSLYGTISQTVDTIIYNAKSFGSYGVMKISNIRPVINLKSDVKITGGIGTSNDPYIIAD